METKTLTFLKGMDTDTTNALRDGTSYLLAKNFTISDSESGEFGSLTNVNGNDLSTLFNVPAHSEHIVVGYAHLRNNIIFFTSKGAHSYIWEYNPEVESLAIVYSDENTFITDGSLMNFSTDPKYKIAAVGSYEKDNVQKIYWTDGKEVLRYLNIKEASKPTRVQDLNIIPIGKYIRPVDTEVIVGGNLKAGRIQYCYRLVNKYGSESSFSDCTDLISLTKSVPNGKSTYYGSDRDDIVNKSIVVTVPSIGNEFEIIRLYSVFYDEVNSVPKIRLVAEMENTGGAEQLKITDVGEVLEEISLEIFNTLGGRLFTAEALETKDNILFAGGITEDKFDIDLDCRAYSFSTVSGSTIASYSTPIITNESFNTNPPATTTLQVLQGTYGQFNVLNNILNFPSGTTSFKIKARLDATCLEDLTVGQIQVGFRIKSSITNETLFQGEGVTSSPEFSADIFANITKQLPLNNGLIFEIDYIEVGTVVHASLATVLTIYEIIAYDMQSASLCNLYNSEGDLEYSITTSNTSDPSWNIPLSADAINPYTDVYKYNEYEYRNTQEAYKYKSDGVTLGGSGKIISYEFIDYEAIPSNLPITTAHTSNIIEQGYLPNMSKESVTNDLPGFKRGEVYRCGIQFFDKYGKPSFTNWIADIRIPYTFEWDQVPLWSTSSFRYFYASQGNKLTLSNPIKIKFTLNTSNIPSNVLNTISGYKIVSVKREYRDRSVIAQGVAKPTRYDSTSQSYFPSHIPERGNITPYGRTLLDFHSPDIYINRNDVKFSNSKFRMVAYVNGNLTYPSGSASGPTKIIDFATSFPDYSVESLGNLVTSSIFKDFNIKDLLPISDRQSSDNAGYNIKVYDDTEVTFKNRSLGTESPSDFSRHSYGATCLLLSLETSPIPSNYISKWLPIGDIVVDNFKSRFGGNTFYSRLRNTYTSISKFTEINTTSISTIGDTFTTGYSQMLSYADFSYGNNGKYQGCICFPVESSINTVMLKDRPNTLLRLKEYYDLVDWGLQENKIDGVSDFPLQYPSDVDNLYKYNSVYSQVNQYPTFNPKPLFFEEQTKNDTIIVASEKKINGELVDNWTKFLYSNLMELPTNQGKITNLKTVDTKLMCWQEKGVSIIAVNDRYVLSEQPGQLALGSGGILERYDYLSTECGATGKYVIDRFENAVFWIDSDRNKLFMFDSSIKELISSKGIRNYIKNVGNFVNPTIGVDMKTNKIYFKLKDEVLVYDLFLQLFEGVHTYNPKWFVRVYDNRLLSSKGDLAMYTSNEGSKGEFYDIVYPSYVKTVCTDNFSITKVFDTLEWYSKTIRNYLGAKLNIFDDTFSTIRVTNDTQNTGIQPLNYRRSERTFRAEIPRDIVNHDETTDGDIFNNANLDATQLFKRRILDRYANIELEYNNDHDYSFTVPYINVNYRVSNR